MAARMKAFDKCIDELLNAVTSDMIHVDNLKADLRNVAGTKTTQKKQAQLERIRKDVLDEFRIEVKFQINDTLKEELKLQECFDEFENKDLRQRNAWRINGDPQHDTFAQRRQVYLDYIKKLEDAEANLEAELQELKDELAN